MALTVALGKSLFSLGIGLSDVSLVLNNGRTLGNWVYAQTHDKQLFDDILGEDMEALLKRRGLVDQTTMNSRWSKELNVVANGKKTDGKDLAAADDSGHLDRITWLMSAVITAIDLCLTTRDVEEVVVDTFIKILRPEESTAQHNDFRHALKTQVGANIQAWRSVGVVRDLVQTENRAFNGIVKEILDIQAEDVAIPQMNPSEKSELTSFLVWLMADTTGQSRFETPSVLVYAVAGAISTAGICLNCTGTPMSEAEPTIRYIGDGESILQPESSQTNAILVPPQQNCFPMGKPDAMIEALPVDRSVKQKMKTWWPRGADAAKAVKLCVFNEYISPGKDLGLLYRIGSFDKLTSSFDGNVMRLASKHFPVDSEQLLRTLEDFLQEIPADILNWLVGYSEGYRHGNLEISNLNRSLTPQQADAFSTLQALVFGYYYALFEPWVCLDFCQPNTYFRGFWGFRDESLFRWCNHFAKECRGTASSGVSRSEVLSMLSVMFAGNQTYANQRPAEHGVFNWTRANIIAIVSNISIFSASLVQPCDTADSVGRFVITALPVLNLLTTQHGELYAADVRSSMTFHPPNPQHVVRYTAFEKPTKKWNVLPRIVADENGTFNSVMMIARCGGRLVGTFSPLLADEAIVKALSCPQTECKTRKETDSESAIDILKVTEDHFISESVCSADGTMLVVVQSHGSPEMRYAAAGLYELCNRFLAPESVACLTTIRHSGKSCSRSVVIL